MPSSQTRRRTKLSDRDAVRAIIGEGVNQCAAALTGVAAPSTPLP